MADIKNLVSEFEIIANAQVGINSFKYANSYEVNEFRTDTKPLLMLHKQRSVTFTDFEKKFKDYTLVVGIYDTYLESQKLTIDYQTKQSNLEDLMEQFLREVRSRYLGETVQSLIPKDWFMLSGDQDIVRFELIEVMGSDKLIGIESTMVFRTFSDCDTGTFNY